MALTDIGLKSSESLLLFEFMLLVAIKLKTFFNSSIFLWAIFNSSNIFKYLSFFYPDFYDSCMNTPIMTLNEFYKQTVENNVSLSIKSGMSQLTVC